jgi:Na+-transporting methylmalonyl-CoA/oxaloacetate decarboxylase gamma subunit
MPLALAVVLAVLGVTVVIAILAYLIDRTARNDF